MSPPPKQQIDIAGQRQAFIAAARALLGTPYVHRAMVRGAGVDCLTLIILAGQDAGILGSIDVPPYDYQFNLHNGDETYLNGLLGHTREVERPEPGDIALWKFGRKFSHAAIVIDWPTVIHAHADHGVVLEDAEASRWLSQIGDGNEPTRDRPVKFLSYW